MHELIVHELILGVKRHCVELAELDENHQGSWCCVDGRRPYTREYLVENVYTVPHIHTGRDPSRFIHRLLVWARNVRVVCINQMGERIDFFAEPGTVLSIDAFVIHWKVDSDSAKSARIVEARFTLFDKEFEDIQVATIQQLV